MRKAHTAMTARTRTLEATIKDLREKLVTVIGKSDTDDKLIDELRVRSGYFHSIENNWTAS